MSAMGFLMIFLLPHFLESLESACCVHGDLWMGPPGGHVTYLIGLRGGRPTPMRVGRPRTPDDLAMQE
ncbi:hypothetical protein CEB94_00920 [Streptomyces hawaiiensis]|uniref:Uncharacterized protein n=1 Tax=Streptomyces hawaiiensis TaxID=67305 RepID=A0A6G5R6P3_9ACTN|nr:hypothetical protein CEB94_00920 [Streptomyces hawaiiensis]